MTTQANHKQHAAQRRAGAERGEVGVPGVAWMGNVQYPAAELTEDWKKVLFNQFHDLAAGSGIGVIYKDAQKDYDVVRWSTDEISAKALATVAENIDTEGTGIPVLVLNPLGWARSGDVDVTVQVPSAAAGTFRA